MSAGLLKLMTQRGDLCSVVGTNNLSHGGIAEIAAIKKFILFCLIEELRDGLEEP